MAFLVLGAKVWLIPDSLSDALTLLALGSIGASSYCALAAWRVPELRADFRRVRGRRATPAPQPA
jgi:hypothetical protein